MRIAALYALFAALSILINIGTQMAWIALYDGAGAIVLSIGLGTASGLVSKYLLDKRWIFHYATRDRRDEVQTFVLYTVMGVLTTGMFWGTELAFHAIFGSDAMRYLGGVVGLVAGYAAKYRLDKRYVFVDPEA